MVSKAQRSPHSRGGLTVPWNAFTPFEDPARLAVDLPYFEPEYRTMQMENPLLSAIHGFERAGTTARHAEGRRTNRWGWIG